MEDSQKVVRDGYQVIASTYNERRLDREEVNIEWLDGLAHFLPSSGRAVDLGCGAGVPITRYFANLGLDITGYDLSEEMLVLAREQVPSAKFVCSSMDDIELPECSLDLVTSFFAIIHLERSKHRVLFQNIYAWLRPGGVAFLSLGAGDNPSQRDEDWHGAPMFWSHFDADENLRLLRDVGFDIVWHEVEDLGTEQHLNVIAKKVG